MGFLFTSAHSAKASFKGVYVDENALPGVALGHSWSGVDAIDCCNMQPWAVRGFANGTDQHRIYRLVKSCFRHVSLTAGYHYSSIPDGVLGQEILLSAGRPMTLMTLL